MLILDELLLILAPILDDPLISYRYWCRCMRYYNFGKKIEAYCAKWEAGDESEWCYLDHWEKAKSCPGATRSTLGGHFYWTNNAWICKNGKIILNLLSRLYLTLPVKMHIGGFDR